VRSPLLLLALWLLMATAACPASQEKGGSGGAGRTGGSAGGGSGTGKARPWLEPCKPEWTQAQCCTHYCECMAKSCPKQTPADCMNTCVNTKTWNLRCRVEQCFESRNPKYPADGPSHCGHAVEKPPKCQNLVP
jgi:hypothetical protein